MKVMFVANRVPYPPYRGDKLKIWNLAKRLSKHHELHLYTIAQEKEELQHLEILKTVFKEVHIVYLPKWKSVLNSAFAVFGKTPFQVAFFLSLSFAKILNQVLQKDEFDAIHIQHIRMSRYFKNLPKNNTVLDLPDAFSLYWKRRTDRARWPWLRWFAAVEQKRLLRMEGSFLKEFPLTLVCSEEDKQYLSEFTNANIQVLPNGVDTDVFYPRETIHHEPYRLLFTGNMDYAPNVDAVEYFCAEILPRIEIGHPDVKFVIAGQRPVKRVLDLASDNVLVTGFVKDLSEEYAKAAVVVAPLRFGAGTQNKVLEALAMGVPVVCTQVGFKGLGIQNGEGAYMAQNTDEFAAEVNRLLDSEENRKMMAGKGIQKIVTTFGWDAVAAKLLSYFETVKK
ncbi:MAG: glycosyltransferase [Sphingomonadales bacterium]|nr:glycosyltransferase [Sphingomonadales bacterium]